ncbi:hypothetical protein [Paraflavitalea sp. CAU 1676]|uniref:hypothetical protein n=1 Tax=Paraflavitalea sp. CAU 1676 TaxID=3032598 RepID=UPI0023DC8BAE|nr:hypothetical protein [Paraflavitalea sp. CAU 1676]MDF2188535.1 hypothetical protein [Paraflavitalea sp. CAU 1676]
MITSKKLKTWTIITHAFILVGFGHGGACFLIIEALWFPYFTREPFSLSLNAPFESHLPVVGLTTLLGQIAFIISILKNKSEIKLIFQITGLVLFWMSIVYFTHYIDEGYSIGFSTITCLPFIVCTIITFVGRPIKGFYNWVLDK